MDFAIGILTFGTLASVATFAYINIQQTNELRRQGYRSALAGARRSETARD